MPWAPAGNIEGPRGPAGLVEVYEQPGDPGASQVGAIWIDTDAAATTGQPRPPLVTALPTAPLNGDEVYFLADSTAGVIWHLRYREDSPSAYKWEVLGTPSPLVSLATATEDKSGVNQSLTTPITAPLVGEYDCLATTSAYNNSTNGEAKFGISIAGGTPTRTVILKNPDIGNTITVPVAVAQRRVVGVGQTIGLRVTTSAGTTRVYDRELRVTPVRVM